MIGPQLLQQVAHPARFQLEDRRGLRALQQLVRGLVVERHGLQVEGAVAQLVHVAHRPVEDRERGEAEEVELDEARLLDVVLVELAHHRRRAFGAIERREVREPPGRDEHAARVHAHVAREALQRLRERHQLGDFLLLLHQLLQLRLDEESLLERDADLEGNQLRDAVHLAVGHREHASHVAHDRLRRHRAEGRDLRDALGAVFLLHVVDDAVATVLAEIYVEVGHRHALRIQEALEQQVVAQRVEVGDAERIGDERSRAGAAAGTHRNAVRLRPVDEVGDDEEVARETHLDDGLHLELEPVAIALLRLAPRAFLREKLPEAAVQAAAGGGPEVILDGFAVGRREVRQAALAERELESATPRDFHGVLERLGIIREEPGHLGLRLEVLLGAEFTGTAVVAQHEALRDAHARFVRLEIAAFHELHGMRRHDRKLELGRERHRGIDERTRRGGIDPLDLEVIAAGKVARPAERELAGLRGVAREQAPCPRRPSPRRKAR